GNYELPLGITLRELVAHGGGVREGRNVKAVIPGGSSAAILPAALPDGRNVMDLVMDFDACRAAGSMLGSGAVMVLDETVCMACAVTRFIEFYQHESCGKCTPCREGTIWMLKILERVTGAGGTEADLFLVNDLASHIPGRSLCLLGDSAAAPLMSAMKHFRADFDAHNATGHCSEGCIPF
ncbi:MAG: SLBB domain-containing protein, partial [Chloroflexota bacterium]|nr:SLBB domain-containing protein [Chloroflexota bacterium]